MALRPELQQIVDALLAASGASREVTLDAIGEAIGVRGVTSPEIDAMIAALEARGRKVSGPQGGDGEQQLAAVVRAARELTPELGRKPTAAEIAARAGLTAEQVRHALDLLTIMQR
ncbi:MAG: hypothetical protein JWP97_1694 [Labilithrix sp.]|nr:hypothetical protein [Labilithrix sp.]